ncbi:hypothetical protein [Arthrobacter sp. E3]|uniref:hypothetical protein n=1 Tax=Arthrobacter sp. E3 TaxID=517402 RepID=UPI001A93F9B6|nr:hypothetical protein [Arthrobacter sp. E3]
MNRLRNAQLVSAIVFLLAAVAFTFEDTGIYWAWSDTPVVGAILVVISLIFWVFFVLNMLRTHRTESHE